MAKQRAAVLGTGQTHHRAKRPDVSMAGLCREAIDRAMADAQVGWDDIDAVVVGKAPDFFEGVMMPELFLADALGAVGKPLLRVHTAGSVGGSTAIVAASLVQAGVHKRVLAVAWEKQSESNAMWALSIPVPFNMPVNAGAGGYFAPHVRSYIRRSGAPSHIGALVAVKDRLNGAKNPYAHLQQPDITLESVQASQMLWDPIRYDETCPSSDGACAVVIGNEEAAASAERPAWIHGRLPCARNRRLGASTPAAIEVNLADGTLMPRPRCGSRRGSLNPAFRRRSMSPRVYVPFSWFEPMWLETLGFMPRGRRLEADAEAGDDRDRREAAGSTGLPAGVLSSNPIGASGSRCASPRPRCR